MTDASPAVRLSGVGYRVPEKAILSDLTLDVAPGTFTVVVGENGAGKSTLFQLLMGFLRPTSGRVEVLGKEPWKDPYADRARIGFMAERVVPPPDWSVGDYLSFHASFYRASEAEGRLLEAFRISRGWRIGALSAGQVRRAQAVAALAARPELLLVDEITAVLDIVGRARFNEAALELRRERDSTIVLATNILDDVDAYATHVVLLHAGRLALAATREETVAQGGGGTLTRALARLIEDLDREGGQ